MKKDITTKDTIKAITYDIATYILKLKISEDFEFVDKELQTIEKREADIVALCKIDGIESILHIEIQNSNDKLMNTRMLRYYTDIKTRFDNIPIYQYLIYIGKPKLSMKDKVKDININFKYNIIDMHTIDCEELIKLDTPDALVLSILCDFKGKDELEMLVYITTRLSELTKDNEHGLGKYMLILETLSSNRDLKDKLKKAEDMLRTTRYEDLPSYEIGMQRGEARGEARGQLKGKLEGAIIMIDKFGLSIENVSKELQIPIDELRKQLNK